MVASRKNVVRKRPGRPATGQDPVTAIRLSNEMRRDLDDWRGRQEDTPSRSEAIRRLVEAGLSAARVRGKPFKGAGKAKELAAGVLDNLGDDAASEDQREARKKRLLKGPSEFRK